MFLPFIIFMTEQQEHLKNLLDQRDNLTQELNSLNQQFLLKRELFLKIEGAIEYLNLTGVSLESNQE